MATATDSVTVSVEALRNVRRYVASLEYANARLSTSLDSCQAFAALDEQITIPRDYAWYFGVGGLVVGVLATWLVVR